ncbi:hypothetical protein TPB0596_09740 [Tsukamurella pulmonis]|uniref:DUF559 domain-containing protein n=1 Tax=Tsukamurella pulmonis TaxID=47312 RepID=UPI001EDDE886|nr:DUF559 domain-containing protein [Tsukamurella pulmonis]BDD81211.1 hypothetical protein TPB0596_09740 [Tsukamurella pulmonis]
MNTIEIIERMARADGGVVSRRALLRNGADAAEIEKLRSSGTITGIRPGWYAVSDARPVVVAAVTAGAAVTCVSALSFHSGVWLPPGRAATHLRWPRHLVKQRTHRRCRAFRTLPAPIRAVDPLPLALLCAANCLPDEEMVAVLDSVLRRADPMSVDDLQELFAGAPQRISRLLGLLDPAAESGTESITRYRLHCLGIRVRSQVRLPWGRVDLLVGDKLVIECDSEDFHGGSRRRADLRRDRIAVRGDYRVMRIDYQDVMSDWAAVREDILDIVRTDRHLGRTRRFGTEIASEPESGFGAA